MSEKRDQSVEAADALKILHDNCRQNIEFTKNQQWRITHYALLIYAVLIAVTTNRLVAYAWPSHSLVTHIATFISIVVATFGIYMLFKLQQSQRDDRATLTNVERHFPREYHAAIQPTRGCFPNHEEIRVFLSLVILVGLVVTLWLLWFWV